MTESAVVRRLRATADGAAARAAVAEERTQLGSLHVGMASTPAGRAHLAGAASRLARAARLQRDAADALARAVVTVSTGGRSGLGRSSVSIGFTDAASITRVRARVTTLLDEWGCSAEETAEAVLLVSELVTNAIRHAGGPGLVLVSRFGPVVRLAVHDHSPVPPAVDGPGVGLRLVASTASRWGSEPAPLGKVVWAEIEP